MMVELLCAGLIGEGFSFEAQEYDVVDGGPPRGGEFMMAIDPSHFGDADGWQSHGEAFFQQFLGMDGTRLPSARRYTNRQKTRAEGATVAAQLMSDIKALVR